MASTNTHQTDTHLAAETQYESGLTRRQSLKWLGALSASLVLPSISGCSPSNPGAAQSNALSAGHWPTLDLPVIRAKGYGKDPDLILPVRSPWPKTLTKKQLNLVAVLSDILIPREGSVPSASEVNVPDVVDEWVSAPYARQQNDRMTILSTLEWIDNESLLRFNQIFVLINDAQQRQIMDDIAYSNQPIKAEFQRIVPAFSAFRQLVMAAFFCSPEGSKDLGYMGNVPIAGDYPGPTEEAMQHLNLKLKELGLTL